MNLKRRRGLCISTGGGDTKKNDEKSGNHPPFIQNTGIDCDWNFPIPAPH